MIQNSLSVFQRISVSVGLATVLTATVATAQNGIIPAERLVPWVPGVTVGVPGGIPTNRTVLIDVTQAPYNADKTGATNASSAIQAAINAAAPGQVVYLPAGTYRIDGMLYLGSQRSNITLRGAGMDATVLDCRMNNNAIYVGSNSDYRWDNPSTNNIVIGGQTKGSTTLTVADTSPFNVGNILNLAIENQTDEASIRAGASPVVSIAGYENVRRQKTRLVSKTTTTLTIFPGLYDDYRNLKVRATTATFQSNFTGIEDLTIDCSIGATQVGVQFEQCYGSWIKGVKVKRAANYAFSLSTSLNCEIRGSYADQRSTNGTNGAGLLIGMSSACLIEDNILYKFFPLIEVNSGAAGNVFAYNFCHDSTVYGVHGMAINTNHAPHNSFNLYEGNVATNLQCDGYFGGGSDDTIFRNWLHGSNPGLTTGAHSIILNRFTRNYSIVGNILGRTGYSEGATSYGNPNLGNGSYNGTANPLAGHFWSDWKMSATLSVRNGDDSGTLTLGSGTMTTSQYITITWGKSRRQFYPSSVSGNIVTFSGGAGNVLPPAGTLVSVWTGSGGYQELDLGVEYSTIKKGNFNAKDGRIPPAEAIDAATPLPNSLYRSTKPSWFGALAWPPFDPAAPNQSFEAIPAGYRFANAGVQPPVASATAPVNVRIYRQ